MNFSGTKLQMLVNSYHFVLERVSHLMIVPSGFAFVYIISFRE